MATSYSPVHTRIHRPFCGWLLLLLSVCQLGLADDTKSIQTSTNAAARLYHSGDVLAAKRRLQEAVAQEPTQDSLLAYLDALDVLTEICESVYDYGCVSENFIRLINLPVPPEQEELKFILVAYHSLIHLAVHSRAGDTDAEHAENVFQVFEASLSKMLSISPEWYVRANLAQADVLLSLGKVEEANLPLGRAIAGLVTITQPADFYLAKHLRILLDLLIDAGQADRANRLFNVAYPLLDQAATMSVPEGIRTQLVLGRLHVARNETTLALSTYKAGIELLGTLIVEEDMRIWFTNQFLINTAALCIITDDIECADAALAQHPLANDTNLIKNGRFRNAMAYLYAAAKIIVDVDFRRNVADLWLEALEQNVDDVSDQAELDLIQIYGKFARGYALSTRDSASISWLSEQLEATNSRLSLLENETIGYYQPNALDRFFTQVGLLLNVTGTSAKSRSNRENNTALRLIQANNRSLRDIDGDRLWTLANASDESERRRHHSADRLRSRQMFLESELLSKQIDLALARSSATFVSDDGIDFPAFERLAEVGEAQRRIEAELAREHPESDNAELHVDLATVQQYLKPDEALVSVTVASDSVVSVCVRQERALVVPTPSDIHELDANLQAVQKELQLQSRPSVKQDSTFAVDAAVMLYQTLLEPVRECFEDVDHIVWVPPAWMNLVPIGVLLPEEPPREGDLYDLSAARWLAKGYAVSYATSIRAFIAARIIGEYGETDLSFLGVGDPLLSARLDGEQTGKEALVADTVVTRSGPLDSLWELPETSSELQSIANDMGNGARLLLRESATEQDFRNQPLSRYKTIAFATHGLIRTDGTPNRESALVLTPENRQQSWNDGLLTASEIADLNLRAKMVTLSACNAANFDWSVWAGETLGLTTAFATAGVPALMATLWPVESGTSKRISSGLYSSLAAGEPRTSPAIALQQSVAEFLAAPPARTHLHPRYWAPFVMFGDGGTEWPGNPELEKHPLNEDFLGRFNMGGAFSDVRLSATGKFAYISGYGDMVNGRYQSLVAKVDAHAGLQWIEKDAATGSTHIISADDAWVLLASFVVENNERVTVIRKLDNDGNEIWRRNTVLEGGWSGYYVGSYISNDGTTSIVLLAERKVDESTEQSLQIIGLSSDGEQISRKLMPLPRHRTWRKAAVRKIDNQVIIAVTSYSDIGNQQYQDPYGLSKNCTQMPSTLLLRLNAVSGEIEKEHEFRDIEINEMLHFDGGKILGAATIFRNCVGGSAAAIVEIGDGNIVLKYTHAGGPDASGYALIRDFNGGLVLVGSSERVFGSRSSEADHDVLEKIDATVTQKIADTFIARFGSMESEPSMQWIQGGASMGLSAGVLFSSRLLLAGFSGQQPYWVFVD